jgi:FMN phosphatase YigB (HAD superfamily)
MRNRKMIIFDLDGTLYSFKGGSFKQSGVYKKVLLNTEKYIADKLQKNKIEARSILKEILTEYGEKISIGLEEKFKIDRYDYFNTAWDIEAKRYIKHDPRLRRILVKLKKDFDLIVISDAPIIWIKRVLRELKSENLFKKIFSGEGNIRKEFGNAFEEIVKVLKIEPQFCIVFGDQEETDIIPAKKVGMRTVLVNKKTKSSIADYTIKSIQEIEKAIKYLNF